MLAPGSAHLFYVRGISADGLADVSPAHRVVDVDPQADLAVAMTAGQTTVKKGGTLTWTTAVRNLGSSASTGTRLTQGLPAGTTFGSASVGSSTSLCSFTSGVVQCAVPGLAGGSSATVTVRTTVTAAKGTLSSTASVTSTSWDPVTTNNGASTTVSINNGK